jgi:hypothetical protein
MPTGSDLGGKRAKTAHVEAGMGGFEQKVAKVTKVICRRSKSRQEKSTSLASVACPGFDWCD